MTGTQPLTDDDPRRIGGYVLTGRLGQGGQGVVYLGHPEADPEATPVAVKTLHADGLDAAGLRRALAEEVETARKVARFCTSQVLAADIDADPPYVVSEYIEGPSLREVVRRDGPMSGAALERLAVGTLTALAAIHQAGIVHRDFKPGNVLMGPDGPRVIDFGIARALEGTAILTSQIAGTPAYMAPEQVAGEALGPAVDLFAWGATMVYAANGFGPFGQDSLREVLHNVVNEPPDLGALDGRLRDIAARCLAKDPAARPTAAETLMGVLGVGMADAPQAAEAVGDAPDEPANPGELPLQTLATGAVAAAAPEARERAVEEIRDSLPHPPGGDLFRSFPSAPPATGPQPAAGAGAGAGQGYPAGTGPQYPAGTGPQYPAAGPGPRYDGGPGYAPQAPPSGPQTPPAHSGPQQPLPGGAPGPAYGPGPAGPAPANPGPWGPQPTQGGPGGSGGPGGPAWPHSGPQTPYPSGSQTPYASGPQAPPSSAAAPYAPGPHSGPQAPYAPGPHSGPQAPYPGGGAPMTGAQPSFRATGPQSGYGPATGPQWSASGPGGPGRPSGDGRGGGGAIIAVVTGLCILVVVAVVVVIVAVAG
ncbi:protein kinase [Streptomonospora sp. S1-112]|uniref:Protein kinase n=1 Tax=Streptomonospora mangrovi TaxID=2883123 RepID=A0A9X3NIY3_9ACTN|nr:protein kinase [Streptomonospora mangrovi]MDA0563013.1 protein kinase [Streptomonospora mangrovi]